MMVKLLSIGLLWMVRDMMKIGGDHKMDINNKMEQKDSTKN